MPDLERRFPTGRIESENVIDLGSMCDCPRSAGSVCFTYSRIGRVRCAVLLAKCDRYW